MGKMGRPLKYTEERAEEAIEAAKIGASIAGCGRAAGVSRDTIENWLDKAMDEDYDDIPLDFFASFMRARWQGEQELLKEAREKDGHASFQQYLLSTSFKYKKTEKKELTGEDGGPVEVDTIIEVMRDAREEEK
jgi:hypothetical protein